MNKKWLVVSTGFALFSMFFGSGNLVFPIVVGHESGGHVWLAALGLLLTGVAVPFLGVFGMMLYDGEINRFFRWFGKRGTLIFSFLALGLMGPFGVLARCLTVAHGALLLIVPHVSLPLASFVMCAVIFFMTVNKSSIVTILGTFLTPFLLLSIAAISYFGLSEGVAPLKSNYRGWTALMNGFFQGYQTMDLLAAFFFSQFVIKHLFSKVKDGSAVKVFCFSALLGGGLLAIVYFALVLLGWIYSPVLADQPPQEMLGLIAMHSLGVYAAPCVCIAVIFACLTTSIVLTSLFADFIRVEVSRDKIGNTVALLITLSIGFLVSTLEFSGIARFICPILEMIYPALIVLTVVNIVYKFWGEKVRALFAQE